MTGKRKKPKEMTNREAIQLIRREQPEWAQFSEANLLRRYYEAKKRQRDAKARKP